MRSPSVSAPNFAPDKTGRYELQPVSVNVVLAFLEWFALRSITSKETRDADHDCAYRRLRGPRLLPRRVHGDGDRRQRKREQRRPRERGHAPGAGEEGRS